MTFRPDIEGLRAVAIVLVVAAHAGVAGLAGGFVGVDVAPSCLAPRGWLYRHQAQRQDRIVFRDAQHLTASYARTLGAELARRLSLGSVPEGGLRPQLNSPPTGLV